MSERRSEAERERQTEKERDRDRQTDRQRHRQTDRERETETGRQIDRQTDRQKKKNSGPDRYISDRHKTSVTAGTMSGTRGVTPYLRCLTPGSRSFVMTGRRCEDRLSHSTAMMTVTLALCHRLGFLCRWTALVVR